MSKNTDLNGLVALQKNYLNILDNKQDVPEFLYWLLWGSLGLVGVGLLYFLRPKKNLDGGQQG